MMYPLVHELAGDGIPVTVTCRVLKIARQPYYRCAARTRTPTGCCASTFPRGTDLSRWSAEEIEAVAHALNTRPRKTLAWKTPAEAFNEHLLLLQQPGVASTD